ncbi:MAG: hypothetical protein E7033_02820 [Akkermansiaceae bacterium]|nr:hypothetical protein [Akkermansiaceae bacterium]
MSLRDKLMEILPDLLPLREEDAIKGTELIAKVRAVLGATYSDRSLRSQFSFIALEPDSCLARVENGQGYYLRQEEAPPSLQHMFESEVDATRSGNDPQHKALALAVRLYDTAGMGVFVFPPEPESWEHPDLVAVQWPAGSTDAAGTYIFAEDAPPEAHLRAVCVETATDAESTRKAFFRTLACSPGAQQAELLLIGPAPENAQELAQLAALYGVGIRCISAPPEALEELPRADEIFRAEAAEAAGLLAEFAPVTLAHPRHRQHPTLPADYMPAMAAAQQWAQSCLSKGRVEAYELRVAVN